MKRIKRQSILAKRARKGFRGYPVATVAFYGPTADRATKAAVGIARSEGAGVDVLERWWSEDEDVRFSAAIGKAIREFIQHHGVKSVALADWIIGCPHEEGVDYPEGESCPRCPYWAERDRSTGEVIVAVSWYRREQWERLREVAADPDVLEETYDEWRALAEKALGDMGTDGIVARPLDIDVEELLRWCQAEGRALDQRARAEFTSMKASGRGGQSA